MDESKFWEIIEASRMPQISKGLTDEDLERPDYDAEEALVTERICNQLRALKPKDVKQFQKIFEEKQLAIYRQDIWAVVTIVQDGCTEEGLLYFAMWLICQGREFYELIEREPARLAEFIEHGRALMYENVDQAAPMVYEEKTGDELDLFVSYEDRDPAGDSWDEEDLVKMYPDIFKRYGLNS